MIEKKQLFTRVLKEDTVSVGRNKSLRLDFVPSIVRAYMDDEDLEEAKKFYYLGSVFESRSSKDPNELHDIGLEVVGSDQPIIDAELILIAYNIFDSLKFDVNIQIGNLGCRKGRKKYIKKLREYLTPKKNWLCKNCKKNLEENLLAIFKCENKECQEVVEDAPQLVDNLCSDCKKHFVEVLESLDEVDVAYRVDPLLVEAKDYNMETVFEFCLENEDGEKIVLGKGGRHNKVAEDLGADDPIPAVGWKINMDKLVKYGKKYDVRTYGPRPPKVFLAQVGKKAAQKALSLFGELKEEGILVAKNFTKRSLKEQLKEAKEIGVDLTLILGEKETKDDTIIIRNMETSNQETVDQAKLIKELNKKL